LLLARLGCAFHQLPEFMDRLDNPHAAIVKAAPLRGPLARRLRRAQPGRSPPVARWAAPGGARRSERLRGHAAPGAHGPWLSAPVVLVAGHRSKIASGVAARSAALNLDPLPAPRGWRR
jgi:hypothetical protein